MESKFGQQRIFVLSSNNTFLQSLKFFVFTGYDYLDFLNVNTQRYESIYFQIIEVSLERSTIQNSIKGCSRTLSFNTKTI